MSDWEDAPGLWEDAPTRKAGSPEIKKRSTAEQLARQVALTGRAAVQGVGNILALPGTIYDAAADAVGAGGVRFRTAESIGNWLTKAGVPAPENASERVAQDVAGAMAGQGGMMKIGDFMARSAGPVISRIGDLFRTAPVSQVASAGGSAGAAGIARENDVGPVGQTVAGILGGVAAPAALEMAKAAGRTVKALPKPFTQEGREQVVGGTLRRLASSPDDAAKNMADAPEYVPGSTPTAAQASGDYGLLIAEKGVRSSSPQAGAKFAERGAAVNAARAKLLDTLAQDDAALKAARGAREGVAGPEYQAAFSQTVKPSDQLVSLLQRPAMQEAAKRAQSIAAEQGIELGDPQNTMRGLHYLKLALDDILDGAKVDTSMGRTQRAAITATREKLLSFMDEASPEYAKARASFKAGSQPVNAITEAQDIRARTSLAAPDAAGNPVMSQAKWANVVTKNEADLARVFTPDQMKTLKALGQDLDRGVQSEVAGRAPGSNTFQNLSTANVIGAVVGGKSADSPMIQSLMRPLSFIYKLPEGAVQDLLVEAMLDPKLAAALMAKASAKNVDFAAAALKDRMRASGIGAAVGTGTTPQRREEEQAR